MLTSAAREALRGVEHVIVDEVHAIAGTKRGAHLALSLERLEALRDPRGHAAVSGSACRPRSGRSTRSPASWAGSAPTARSRSSTPATARRSTSQVVVPVDDMAASARSLPLDEQPGGPATSRGPADEHLAGDPPAPSSS